MNGIERGIERLRRLLGMTVDEEVGSELDFHLAMRVHDLQARGLDAETARRRALREFGDLESISKECRTIATRRNRKMKRVLWAGEFRQDAAYALRQFVRAPGFTLVAVLTLALGIGANSAIFSVVDGVLLKPLAYRAPERLVFLYSQFPTLGFEKFWVSPPEYREMQQNLRSFSRIGAWRTGSVSLSGIESPMRVTAAGVTAEFFETLGVTPERGRTFTREEDTPDAPPVVVISDGLWRGAYGSDPDIVGRQVEVNGARSEVVGVMPPGFDVEDAGVDVWTPLGLQALPTNRGSHFLNLVGRLAPGATLTQAQGEISGLLHRWSELAPEGHVPNDSTHRVLAKPLRDEMVGDVRPALLMLLGAVGLVLLIACANVANLLLTRAEVRQKEIAVRAALGAGRRRLARQFLTESVILALAGGALGLLLGWAGVRALLAASPDSVPRAQEIGLDGRVILFTLGVSVLTGILFGLAPLMHLSPRAVGASLRDGGQRTTATGGRQRVRRALMAAEVGLAVVLVVSSGLLLRSFAALQRTDPGFDPNGLLTFQLFLPQSTYAEASDEIGFLQRLEQRLAGMPGTRGVAFMTGLPPQRDVNANDTEFEGIAPTKDGPAQNVDYYQMVGGDYFATMRIPIVQGRAFRETDAGKGVPVAIINQRLAKVFYPHENPIGRRIRSCCGDENNPWLTIVGVAGDVKQGGLSEEAGTELYFYYPQAAAFGFAPRTLNVVVRTDRDPLALAGEARRAVWSLDRSLPLAQLQTMEANVAGAMSRPRFVTMLLGIFAGVALLLAAVGTYGVLSYSVAERRREIGIRLALGARARSVLGMILRDGLAVTGVGLVLGIAGALMATRLLRSLLYGVSATDLTSFIGAPLLLAAVALLACWIPARRATRVDPNVTLRAE
jgi:predicted permease